MPRKVFRLISAGGIGDAILTTPAIRAMKEQYPACKVVVYCLAERHIEVYKNNPYVDVLKFASLRIFVKSPLVNLVRRARNAYRLRQGKFFLNSWAEYYPGLWCTKSVPEILAEKFNVTLRSKHLQIFLTPAEDEKAKNCLSRYSNAVAIHVTPLCSLNKLWPVDRWIELIEKNPAFTFIQLGGAEDSEVKGAVDLRGKTSLRETFGIIKHSRGFVGVESGLAHAAAAFGTPGVVLFGPSSPVTLGHEGNVNLYKGFRCSPCIEILLNSTCPYGKACMNSISVEEVSNALRWKLCPQVSAGSWCPSIGFIRQRPAVT